MHFSLRRALRIHSCKCKTRRKVLCLLMINCSKNTICWTFWLYCFVQSLIKINTKTNMSLYNTTPKSIIMFCYTILRHYVLQGSLNSFYRCRVIFRCIFYEILSVRFWFWLLFWIVFNFGSFSFSHQFHSFNKRWTIVKKKLS